MSVCDDNEIKYFGKEKIKKTTKKTRVVCTGFKEQITKLY